MGILSLRDGLLFSASCALAAHAVFNKFEPSRLLSLVLLLGVLPIFSVLFLRPHFVTFWHAASVAYSTYYVVLGFSVVLYRISPFHPLAKYPGPLMGKISKFWGIWVTANGKQHIYFQDLHKKYGPYIRVGPNELSFLDVDALTPVMGIDGMPKGPMWDGRRNPDWHPSLIALRDVQEHTRRRRIWNKAFSTAAVKEYEPIVVTRALQLVDELEKRSGGEHGGTVDLAKWMSFFTFDFMGDMAFGGGFELMREDDKDGLWRLMERGVQVVALTAHIPWAARLLMTWSILTQDVLRLRAFSVKRATLRKEKGSLTKDLFHHLIDEDGVQTTQPSFTQIVSDGTLAIVAGADTTATVMSNLFYYLLANPSTYTRLRAEVDATFPPGEGDPFDGSKLADLPFLNAVINEAMRLQPPVASGSQRAPQRGSGGKTVGVHFVPEGTAIIIPTYAMHRDPRYFSPAPDAFWPDRWLNASVQPSPAAHLQSKIAADFDAGPIVTTHAAFLPFSHGPANCAGKNLALVEMRMIVCLLLQRFHMRFADEFQPWEWEENLEDWFVMKKGRLPVVLTRRA